jgi:hypothetical protein
MHWKFTPDANSLIFFFLKPLPLFLLRGNERCENQKVSHLLHKMGLSQIMQQNGNAFSIAELGLNRDTQSRHYSSEFCRSFFERSPLNFEQRPLLHKLIAKPKPTNQPPLFFP